MWSGRGGFTGAPIKQRVYENTEIVFARTLVLFICGDWTACTRAPVSLHSSHTTHSPINKHLSCRQMRKELDAASTFLCSQTNQTIQISFRKGFTHLPPLWFLRFNSRFNLPCWLVHNFRRITRNKILVHHKRMLLFFHFLRLKYNP